MKWRLLFILLALAGLGVLVWGIYEGWFWRALGGLLTLGIGFLGSLGKNTAAGAGKVVNDAAKAVGAREVQQKPGAKVPRHEGLITNEKRSVEGEKPLPKTPYNDTF